MKRKLCFLFVLPLLFTACENVLPENGLSTKLLEVKSQTLYFQGKKLNTSYFVDIDVLYKYTASQQETRGVVTDVKPYGPNEDVVLLYVVNYADGWEIISADQRSTAVLAYCEEGQFSLEDAIPGEQVWLETVACDILNLRLADEDTTRSNAAQSRNVSFWEPYVNPISGVDEQTRVEIPSRPELPTTPGRYVLQSSVAGSRVYETVNHMVETKWGQSWPWNVYCPLKTDGSGERAPAGCVAVAGAQMLYYLHNHFGVPQSVGRTNDNYDIWEGVPDSLIWNKMVRKLTTWVEDGVTYAMESDSTKMVAAFLAHIGNLVGMNYGNNGSGAPSVNLQDVFATHYGITSEWGFFDEDVMWSTLLQGLPVYASAYAEEDEILGIPIELSGHAFLIDGYQRLEYFVTHTYVWVPLQVNPNDPPARMPMYTERVVTGYDYVYICMNWGWTGSCDDNGNSPAWYAADRDWQIVDGNGNTQNYQYLRRIMTDWSPMENN